MESNPEVEDDPSVLELSSINFSVNDYIAKTYRNFTLEELQTEVDRLKLSNTKRKSQMKSLVVDNLEQFISCRDVVRSVSKAIGDNESKSSSLDDAQNQLVDLIESNLQPLLQQSKEEKDIQLTIDILKEHRDVFEVPSKMARFLKKEQYHSLVAEYSQLKKQSAHINILLFLKVFDASKSIASEANDILMESFKDLNTKANKHVENLDIIERLEIQETPALNLLILQITALKDQDLKQDKLIDFLIDLSDRMEQFWNLIVEAVIVKTDLSNQFELLFVVFLKQVGTLFQTVMAAKDEKAAASISDVLNVESCCDSLQDLTLDGNLGEKWEDFKAKVFDFHIYLVTQHIIKSATTVSKSDISLDASSGGIYKFEKAFTCKLDGYVKEIGPLLTCRETYLRRIEYKGKVSKLLRETFDKFLMSYAKTLSAESIIQNQAMVVYISLSRVVEEVKKLYNQYFVLAETDSTWTTLSQASFRIYCSEKSKSLQEILKIGFQSRPTGTTTIESVQGVRQYVFEALLYLIMAREEFESGFKSTARFIKDAFESAPVLLHLSETIVSMLRSEAERCTTLSGKVSAMSLFQLLVEMKFFYAALCHITSAETSKELEDLCHTMILEIKKEETSLDVYSMTEKILSQLQSEGKMYLTSLQPINLISATALENFNAQAA